MKVVAAYFAAMAAFLALDLVWLGTMIDRLYRPALGDLLSPRPNVAAAVVFYIAYIAGMIFLAVAPAVREGGMARAALNGMVFGAVAYATYDLTNHATLRGWSTRLTVIDITWGAFASAVACVAGYAAWKALAK
jgi:uncharacterized membrane protein